MNQAMMAMSSVAETQKPPKLRIALVAPPLRPLGGQAVQANLLCEGWRRDGGVEITFIPMDPALPAWLAWIERIRFLRTVVRLPLYLARLWQGVGQADVVHTFAASYWSFLLRPVPAWAAARLQGKKVVLNYRSGEAPDHLVRWRSAVVVLRQVDKLVVPSGYLAAVFARFGLTATVIPSLVDCEQFAYRLRRQLRPRLLCTRSLEPYYGVDIVIRAFAEVKQQVPTASLCLVGSGSLESSLRRLVRDLKLRDVRFAGRVGRGEIPRFYEQADVLVNGSRLDNVPPSILEAFASGLPVVTTNPEGMGYVVEHERTGLLCEVDDWKGLAENVLRLLRNPVLANSLAHSAYQACAAYQWGSVRQQWLRVYQSVLSEDEPVSAEKAPAKEEEAGKLLDWSVRGVASRQEN